MSGEEVVDIPESLKFPIDTEHRSVGCGLGYHQPVWSEKVVIIHGDMYQIGRCRKCGIVGKEVVA